MALISVGLTSVNVLDIPGVEAFFLVDVEPWRGSWRQK